LRDLNFEYSHPIALASEVALCLVDNYELPVSWDLVPLDNVANIHRELLVGPCGCELVPGDCGEMILVERPNGELDAHDESRWDAVAAARRLLAAARDALKAKAGA
jgi:hypothetical protein